MGVLASLLLGMIITLVALALAILFIVFLTVGVGKLGTGLEKSFKKSRQRKNRRPARPTSSPSRHGRGALQSRKNLPMRLACRNHRSDGGRQFVNPPLSL